MADLVNVLSIQELAKLNRDLRSGSLTVEEYKARLESIVEKIYNDGVQMGLTEALNYVTNNEDRERLFSAIDTFDKRMKNGS